MVTAIDRFAAKVDVSGEGCWLWKGAVDKTTGYAKFHDGRTVNAHRWAYLTFVGPIADGLDIDHLCRVRHCVRPDHLEAVTRRENLMRGATLTRAHAALEDCGFDACRSCGMLRATRERNRATLRSWFPETVERSA